MGFSHKIFADPSGVSVDEKKYRGMIGSLLYLTASQSDIMFSTCLCARFQVNPKMSNLLAVKQIFRYLKGTKNLGIWYPANESFLLQAYSDSKYGVLQLNRKSTSGGCQFLGGRLVSWSSKKQNCIALSITEAEYIAAANYHVLNGNIELIFVPSDDQIADVFTKASDETKFNGFMNKKGLMMPDPQFFQETCSL
ncbi:uncharacterized mitochondrial protein AtMg00810-like [Lactuca sativa]|uniref:uncharacterized mitochondrial protein AtMg00810-like n=1 Tax=Lactuca sativa TaxID=4236 RepID=UPI0022B05533|nr:uncharacterized mitochondrial protein AtMg00810-like [Lactuca sativa]